MDSYFIILLAPVYFVPVLAAVEIITKNEAVPFFFAAVSSCVVYGFCENMIISVLTVLVIMFLFVILGLLRRFENRQGEHIEYLPICQNKNCVTFFDGKGIYCVETNSSDSVDSFHRDAENSISLDSFCTGEINK